MLLVGYSTLFAEDGVFSDVLWTFAYEYLLIGYLRIYPDNRLSRAMQTRGAAVLALLFTAAMTALRGVALWQETGGKAMQYLEYYRTALCSAPNLLCALAFFFWFKNLNIGSLRAVNTVASATLGVYIIHQTPAVIGILWNGIFHAAEHPGSAGYALFVIVTVFVACTGIDLLRSRLLIRRLEQTRWFVAVCRSGMISQPDLTKCCCAVIEAVPSCLYY